MTEHEMTGRVPTAPGQEGSIVTAYQVMPPLTDEERAALRDDIERHGVLVPVVRDQHGNIVDGHNRAEIADELGIKYRVDIVSVEDEQQARTLARTLNLARRHLSRAQKRQLIADEINVDPGRSDREIGRLLGCDHKTVGSVRRELRGELPHETPSADEPLTDAEREKFERLTERIERGLRENDQRFMDALRRGVPAALLAHGIRQSRKQFREAHAAELGDDFESVDELLWCGWLDTLAAFQALAPKTPGYKAERAWLKTWAEVRPKQHAREVQAWAEVWHADGTLKPSTEIGV